MRCLRPGHTAPDNDMIRSSVTANMHLIGKRYFLYRYRIVIVCSVSLDKELCSKAVSCQFLNKENCPVYTAGKENLSIIQVNVR